MGRSGIGKRKIRPGVVFSVREKDIRHPGNKKLLVVGSIGKNFMS
jgi:hypothetical protein